MTCALRLREEPKSVVSRRFWSPLRDKGFLGTIKADAGAMEELGSGEAWCEPQPGGSAQDPPCTCPFGPEPLRVAGQTDSCVLERFG